MRALHRTLLALTLALCLTAGLGAATAALAAPKATLSIRVANASNVGLADIDVTIRQSGKVAAFGVTDANGYITMQAPYGASDPITTGDWSVSLYDFNTNRNNAGTPYDLDDFTWRMSGGGDNNLGTVKMNQLTAAYGRLVGASSGARLENVEYRVTSGTRSSPPAVSLTDQDFVLGALALGSHKLEYRLGKKWLLIADFTTSTQGQRVNLGARGVKVKASTVSLAGVSPSKRKMTLTFKIDGRRYGAPDPTGTVVATSGSVTSPVTAVVRGSNDVGKAVVALTGLPKGSRSFTVTYTPSGDLNATKVTKTFVVK